MSDLPLTIGLTRSPYTEALFDGTVRPAGIDLKLRTEFGDGYDNVGARHRDIIAGKIDGGELSISSYILAHLRGVPLIALPVFLSRRFRLRCMYCGLNSPLRNPSELAGRKVTVHRYNATTPVWLRGIIENEFGVKPSEIDWHVAEPDIAEESLRPPPTDVKVSFIPQPRTREHAMELVESGEIDAALEPYSTPNIRYLMDDDVYRDAERKFFRRTGAYTTNHLFALSTTVTDAHPWVIERMLGAMTEANALADRYRNDKQRSEAAWEREVMGEDFQYSLNRGCARRSVETLIDYQIQQGILDRKPRIENLFALQTLKL
jgi:4,5-dihydroxyphthalate decarboxylase